ncbi:MAG TPA: LCP family protein [Clostridiales bacterium]|nr:LCP family protein [Clostridiales bacterium]
MDKDKIDSDKISDDYMPNIEFDENVDSELEGINSSLAEQVKKELSANEELPENKKFNVKKLLIGLSVTLVMLCSLALFLIYTPQGHSLLKKISGKIWSLSTNKFDDVDDVTDDFDDIDLIEQDSDENNLTEIKAEDIIFRNNNGEGRHEDYAYNILLLGEEAIGSYGNRGRTDLIIIATINTKEKSIKLTSLMRDCYVQIPGYNDNKINSVYSKGGVELLYQTIAKNFDIRIDGCVLVNFSNFEQIIDFLGGVEVELTSSEASYLNRTNYISEISNRKVVAGKQIMNGNQALGYSRVRYRKAITGKGDDYGRTDRHRIILNAIFDKYKNLSNVELLTMMYKMLPMLTTDITDKEFEFLLSKFLETGARDMEQLRIPIDGAFRDNVSIRGMDPLVLDFDKNIEALHQFIFGDVKTLSISTENLKINGN